MNVLVTGGAGFIGSHLVERLVAEGHRVTVVDDLSSGRQANLRRVLGRLELNFLEGDFAEEQVVSKLVPASEVVVHLAAKVGVASSVKDPELVHEVNVNKTLRLLGACANGGVRRLVLASSASVYGDTPPPVSESAPVMPLSPYAASKVACEAYCKAYQSVYGLPTVSLRFMNVYGQRMNSAYGAVMSEFARCTEEGAPLVVQGDGEQTRDFVHVSDVVDAIVLGITVDRAAGETINIGTGVPTSITALARMFMASSGKPGLGVIHSPPREGDIRESYADTSKARRVLGFEAKKKLSGGVSEFLKWYLGRAPPNATSRTGHQDRPGSHESALDAPF